MSEKTGLTCSTCRRLLTLASLRFKCLFQYKSTSGSTIVACLKKNYECSGFHFQLLKLKLHVLRFRDPVFAFRIITCFIQRTGNPLNHQNLTQAKNNFTKPLFFPSTILSLSKRKSWGQNDTHISRSPNCMSLLLQ